MRREAAERAAAEAAAAKEAEATEVIEPSETTPEPEEAVESTSVATVAKPKPKAPSRAS